MGRLDSPAGSLSGGQRQVLSLLMATIAPADLLLLDEHTSALDQKTAAMVTQVTKDLIRSANLTTLMVTHKLDDALKMGSRTVLMHQGKIVYDISGKERSNLSTADVVKRFEAYVASDSMLL
jgi:putative ABC transport system ATP-binding protein